MNVRILKRSHSNVNFVRKDFLEMEIERTCTGGKLFKCIECTYVHITKHKQGYNERSPSNVNFVKKGLCKVEA